MSQFGQTTNRYPAGLSGAGQVARESTADIYSEQNYQAGLKIGLFAQLKNGVLSNMDGTATPILSGVIIKNIANPVEDGNIYTGSQYSPTQISYLRNGQATIQVVASDTPVKFGAVNIVNQANNVDNGKATTSTLNSVAIARAEFINEVVHGVWLINLR